MWRSIMSWCAMVGVRPVFRMPRGELCAAGRTSNRGSVLRRSPGRSHNPGNEWWLFSGHRDQGEGAGERRSWDKVDGYGLGERYGQRTGGDNGAGVPAAVACLNCRQPHGQGDGHELPEPIVDSVSFAGENAAVNLSPTKTADRSSAQPGEEFCYTLVIANTGKAAICDIQAQDKLPDRLLWTKSLHREPPMTRPPACGSFPCWERVRRRGWRSPAS